MKRPVVLGVLTGLVVVGLGCSSAPAAEPDGWKQRRGYHEIKLPDATFHGDVSAACDGPNMVYVGDNYQADSLAVVGNDPRCVG